VAFHPVPPVRIATVSAYAAAWSHTGPVRGTGRAWQRRGRATPRTRRGSEDRRSGPRQRSPLVGRSRGQLGWHACRLSGGVGRSLRPWDLSEWFQHSHGATYYRCRRPSGRGVGGLRRVSQPAPLQRRFSAASAPFQRNG